MRERRILARTGALAFMGSRAPCGLLLPAPREKLVPEVQFQSRGFV